MKSLTIERGKYNRYCSTTLCFLPFCVEQRTVKFFRFRYMVLNGCKKLRMHCLFRIGQYMWVCVCPFRLHTSHLIFIILCWRIRTSLNIIQLCAECLKTKKSWHLTFYDPFEEAFNHQQTKRLKWRESKKKNKNHPVHMIQLVIQWMKVQFNACHIYCKAFFFLSLLSF